MNKTIYLILKQGNTIYDEHKYTPKKLQRITNIITVFTIATLLVVATALYSLFSFSYTPTPSMVPTLSVGEIEFMRRVFSEDDLKRGDIVLFDPFTDENKEIMSMISTEGEHYIKRLIGLPGEHICIINDVVYINGEPLDEPYVVYPEERISSETDRNMAGFIIPDGCYFFMGDNRDNSYDSRFGVGVIPYENIQRKVVFHFTSLSSCILGAADDASFI